MSGMMTMLRRDGSLRRTQFKPSSAITMMKRIVLTIVPRITNLPRRQADAVTIRDSSRRIGVEGCIAGPDDDHEGVVGRAGWSARLLARPEPGADEERGHCAERAEEHPDFEGDRHERGNGTEGLPADVDGPVDRGGPPHEQHDEAGARECADRARPSQPARQLQ